MRWAFAIWLVGATIALGACQGETEEEVIYEDTLIDIIYNSNMIVQMGFRAPGSVVGAPADSTLVFVRPQFTMEKTGPTDRSTQWTQYVIFDNPGSAVKQDGTPFQAGEVWDTQVSDSNWTALTCLDPKQRMVADQGLVSTRLPPGPRTTEVWDAGTTQYAANTQMLGWAGEEGGDNCGAAKDPIHLGGPAYLFFACPENEYLESSKTLIAATRDLSDGIKDTRVTGWCEPPVDLTQP